MTLTTHSLFRPAATRAFRVGEVVSVNVEVGRSRDGDTYRLRLATAGGLAVAVTPYFSSGLANHERKAARLRAFIGMEAPYLSAGPQAGGDGGSGQSMKAPNSPVATMSGSTEGIPWIVESGASSPGRNIAFTRWTTTKIGIPDGCTILVQTTPRSHSPIRVGSVRDTALFKKWVHRLGFDPERVSGILKALSGEVSLPMLMFKEYPRMLGIDPDTIPDFDRAESIEALETRLEGRYRVLGTDPAESNRLLDSRAVEALAAWARRFPMRSFRSIRAEHPAPLIVLFTPSALTIGFLTVITEPSMVTDICRLGADLALAAETQPIGSST